MITVRCKFHFRFPASKVRLGRWGNQSQKQGQRVFTLATHSATMCKGNHCARYDKAHSSRLHRCTDHPLPQSQGRAGEEYDGWGVRGSGWLAPVASQGGATMGSAIAIAGPSMTATQCTQRPALPCREEGEFSGVVMCRGYARLAGEVP